MTGADRHGPLLVFGSGDAGVEEAQLGSPALVGGKGASLFRMSAAGLPVPPFFVLTTAAWQAWHARGTLSDELTEALRSGIRGLERETSKSFGSPREPLLVSVRSSGPKSMPGMMDTVLNVGLDGNAFGGLASVAGSLNWPVDLAATLVRTFPGEAVPADAQTQLTASVEAIFRSWHNDRAQLYRRLARIDDNSGTALVVQAIVAGNRDARSCSGVWFSRHPVTGEARPACNWAPASQGEVIVSGADTGRSLADLEAWNGAIHEKLLAAAASLERLSRSPQDIEFTVEQGELYLLQCRAMKMGPVATCRAMLDMFDEGIISRAELVAGLGRLPLDDLYSEELSSEVPALAEGIPAAPGVAAGECERDPAEAIRRATAGRAVVLVRRETSPADLAAMKSAAAIVTERGGETCHAAIVARELNIPAVVGCGDLSELIDGREVTVDGAQGQVYPGRHTPRRITPEVVARARGVMQSDRETADVRQ